MGVPLVAIRGGCTSARMSSSILKGLGKPEWIAETPEQFAAVVTSLCVNLNDLRESKPSLRNQVLASALFNGAEICCNLEKAFVKMKEVNKKVQQISTEKLDIQQRKVEK